MGNFSFEQQINDMAEAVHTIAMNNGWREEGVADQDEAADIIQKAACLLESIQRDNPVSEKIGHPPGWPEDTEFSEAEEDLADIVIRCMDFAHARGFNLGGAIRAKVAYNRQRPVKHGGKLF